VSKPEVVLRKLLEDVDELARRFAERVTLAKMTLEDAVTQTRAEWKQVQRWVLSDSIKPGSFVDCCDRFDLDVGAVRKAIKERVR